MIKGMRMKLEKYHHLQQSQITKYLAVILTNQVKDLYDKNFKSLKKETEGDIRRSPMLLGRIDIIKMSILPEVIYGFTAIPSKSQHNSSQTSKEQYSTSHGVVGGHLFVPGFPDSK